MKATCIVGSARANGSCAYLVDTLIRGLEEGGAETIKYSISQCDIHSCQGCKKCYSDGRCVWTDDVEKILQDLLSSQVAVIASPSYWAGVPGQLKTFFDRTTPYGDTNPNRRLLAQGPILGIAIAVRAGTREEENRLILNAISHYYGHLGIETVKEISICQTDSLEDLQKKHQREIQEIYQLGKELARG